MAIAAALSVPAVALAETANVTLYGVLNMSADYVTTGDPTNAAAAKGVSKLVVSSNQSRLGFKGAEDLGGGLSAIWQIESLIGMDNAGGSLGFGRNTFAGLKSDSMGSVMLGRHDTPYFMATRRLDVFADGIADSRSMTGTGDATSGTAFEGRQPDSIVYISPVFSGFTGAFSHANTQETRTAVGSAAGSINSLAGMYNAGPIFASLAYETHNVNSGTVGVGETSETATKLGFGYTQDAFSVGVFYETTSDDFGPAKADRSGHTAIYVGGKYNLASGAVKAAITQAGERGTGAAANNTDAQQISLGYDHNLSKRTIAYVSYTSISNGDAVNYGLAGASTGGGAATRNGNGADPSAISFGVRHAF